MRGYLCQYTHSNEETHEQDETDVADKEFECVWVMGELNSALATMTWGQLQITFLMPIDKADIK